MKRTVDLAVGPVLFALADGAITLIGQSETYWSGDYGAAHEFNWIGAVLLEFHPLLFVLSLSGWISAFTACIHKLPDKYSRTLSICILLGHSFGLCTWLLQYPFGMLLVVVAMCLMRVAAIPAWDYPLKPHRLRET